MTSHRSCLNLIAFGVLIAFCSLANTLLSQETAEWKFANAEQMQSSFAQRIQPILKKYCYQCHNQDEMESGIRVDHLDGTLKGRRPFLWKEIEKNVSESSMPPEEESQPTAEEKKLLGQWITAATSFVRSQPQPKNGSSRRLTVQQYRNTLRELLGIREDVANGLPPDAMSRDGFINNEKSMLLSPLLIEAYFEAAEKALDICLVDQRQKPVVQNFRVDFGRGINANPYPEKLILGANSRLLENADFVVQELSPAKPFAYQPFQMKRKLRFNEGYQGNSTVRGWRDYDSIYHAVFACVRGNSGYPKGLPYQTVPEGLLLRPSIPSAELFGVSSTYGPQANFKIALRELPEKGNFLIRVKAAKYVGGLLLNRNENAIAGNHKLEESRSKFAVLNPSSTVEVDVPKDGIYQAEIHLASPTEKKVQPDGSRLKEELIGQWDFDQGFSESHGKKDLAGRPLGEIQTTDSPFGKALKLDGRDDSVVVKRSDQMNVGQGEFTVSAWIRPTKLQQSGIVCLGKYSWTHGWYFDMPNGKGILRIETANPDNSPNGTVQTRPGIIRANQWQHVAAVVRRGVNQTRLYVNGFQVAEGTINNRNLDNPKVDLYIGRIQDAQHFQGNIDQVRIYKRALAVEEIQALLAGGESFIQPPAPDKPQLCHLRFENSEAGFREISGTLFHPPFALTRLAKGKLKLKAIYDGKQTVSRIVFHRVDNQSEWGKRYKAFEKRNPRLGVYLGLRRDCGHTLAPVGSFEEVRSESIQEYRFFGAINNFPNPRVEKGNDNYLAGIREIGIRSEYTDGRDMPRLQIQSVEFEGPFYESWPPASHQQIFFDSENTTKRSTYAAEIIRRFASRAYRRTVTDQEVNSLMPIFEESFRESKDFQSSVKDVLLVILSSPQFLFLVEQSESPDAEPISEYELASKLSYFLWNSPPDTKLLGFAKRRQLKSSLGQEVERMIKSDRFNDFCMSFVKQWLNLEKLDVVNIDRKKFPRLTRDTKTELGKEPVEFFKYLVQQNRPVRDLISSDYLLANEITASYYQLKNTPESGFRFQRVPIDKPELGGLLGQAGILSGLSDGRESNPIKRGAWLARKIIAEPPDDPPPNVPELGEDTSHLPLRERLAIHRNQKGCVKCHTGIDPWGLPLEQFDAGGRYLAKPNPNAKSTLPDNTKISGFLALKKYLAEDRIDQVVFSFVKHLTIYAIGRSLTYNEVQSLKQQCLDLKVRDYRMKDIFMLVVTSKMFLEK